MPLWQIKHDNVPSMAAQYARQWDKVLLTVPLQWRKRDAVNMGGENVMQCCRHRNHILNIQFES